ncbi:hypothetical protein BX616_009491 [Lobosporangium transversale]|nr:hypothetical protein BX616_009491 [Lobosporangium transversale]
MMTSDENEDVVPNDEGFLFIRPTNDFNVINTLFLDSQRITYIGARDRPPDQAGRSLQGCLTALEGKRPAADASVVTEDTPEPEANNRQLSMRETIQEQIKGLLKRLDGWRRLGSGDSFARKLKFLAGLSASLAPDESCFVKRVQGASNGSYRRRKRTRVSMESADG